MNELLIFHFYFLKQNAHQIVGFILVHLSDALMVFCCHGKPSHVGVDVNGFQ